MGVSASVRVWLPEGITHEDVGYGKIENVKNKGDGLDKVSSSSLVLAFQFLPVLTALFESLAVQEGSRHGRTQTSPSSIWESSRQLPL